MKVLTVVPLPPENRGGIEDYAYNVARALQGRVDVDILAPSETGPSSHAPPDFDGRLRLLRGRWLFSRLLPTDGHARRIVTRSVRNADVVHIHMPCPRLETWTADEAMRERVPLLVTYHMDAIYDGSRAGSPMRALSGILGRMYDSLSAKPLLSKAQIIATNSLGYARESRVLPAFMAKVRAVHQGVDPTHIRPSNSVVRFRDGLLQGARYLVTYLGRLVPYKGLHILIEAAAVLKDEPITFVIAGKGPLGESLRSQVERRGLGDRFRFLGFVPDAMVGDLLHASDVVVCPSVSLAESTPIVLLEALASGAGIVGTQLGGSQETLPNDGVRGRLVRPKDPVALSVGVRELLAAREWQPGRPSMCTRTWDDVATDYLGLYEELASS